MVRCQKIIGKIDETFVRVQRQPNVSYILGYGEADTVLSNKRRAVILAVAEAALLS